MAIKDDKRIVASLDVQFQQAVKGNDVARIECILADDFVLVTGRGKIVTKADLSNQARAKDIICEHQEDTNQTVCVWDKTAVVTALLYAKGTNQGEPFDYKLWLSDTCVRTPSGWRYAFGQSSLPLPKTV